MFRVEDAGEEIPHPADEYTEHYIFSIADYAIGVVILTLLRYSFVRNKIIKSSSFFNI